jgi:uncharacterized protein (DUF1501 family)
MKRREFMRRTMLASAVAGSGLGLGMPLSSMAATCTLESRPRTLVNLMNYGGMDSKFLFMPSPGHYDTAYLEKIWAARKVIYTANYPDYATMFANEYLPVSYAGGMEFGIYKGCDWLAQKFTEGKVAIIANSFCSRNRRHDQSQLNANAGEPEFNELLYDRSGWGGRLQEYQAAGMSLVELSHEISVFGNGSTEGERLTNVIHAKDMRNIALPNVVNGGSTSRRDVMARALRSYYEARGAEAGDTPDSPYNIFFQHNDAFRAFGDVVQTRINACGVLEGEPAEPLALALNSGHFAQQCQNLYDISLMNTDSLETQILSMRYDGWDTHNNQQARISENLSDLFSLSGGLATATNRMMDLATNPSTNMVFNFTSDFGRQLVANGDRGTDHGRGLYTILIGLGLGPDDTAGTFGGTYGEMFPEREAQTDSNGKIPLETSGADVLGLTSTEKIQTALCDWVQPGSGELVFPNALDAAEETPGLLTGLLPF